MYGIARILLAEGVIDRVLVLCPSLTIEGGLTAKFKQLSGDRRLRDLSRLSAAVRNPEITNADLTTGPGDICVENIHATFEHVRSSVRDSFAGKGGKTLVLNDETHHVSLRLLASVPFADGRRFSRMTPTASPESPDSQVRATSGTTTSPTLSTGYSLRMALADGMVKDVRYVSKDENLSQDERFQKYLQRHRENQTNHPALKPLSIS